MSGKGAFTWITCWANNPESYRSKVSKVMGEYGLFIVDVDRVLPFEKAESESLVTDELLEQFSDTSKNENFCIFGTLHNYSNDD